MRKKQQQPKNKKQKKQEKTLKTFQLHCLYHCLITMEWFCRKTKTKVITPTNHKKRKQHKGPIRIRSKYMCNRCQAREKACERGTIGIGFTSH